MTTMLIVDDDDGFREAARIAMCRAGYEIVGEAKDGSSAITAIRALHPDVVLLDIQLPDIDGFEVTEEAMALAPPPRIVLTSAREAADYGERIVSCSALGFVHKPDLSRGSILEIMRGMR